MHVGLNLVFLVPGEQGGMEIYARELIAALAPRPEVRLTAFVNREAAEAGGPWTDLVEHVVLPVRPSDRKQWVLGEQVHLPRAAARQGVDLVHSLASTGPAWGRFRRIVTVHDLIYRVFPEAHFGARSLGMRVLVPLAARRSDRVIVNAASTRADLGRYLGLDPSVVDVVPLGVGQTRRSVPTGEEVLRTRLDLGAAPVVLSVSAKRPHKNLARLIEAMASVAEPSVLVIPGYPTPYEAELRALAARVGVLGRVRFVDWVSPADLEGLYALASVFAFPSLYEGFGLPVLEAMVRSVPVVCSAAASLAEVAGDAALVVDPLSVPAIAEGVARVLGDHALAEDLRRRGHGRAAAFTWERTAEMTLEAYRRVVG